MGRKIEGFTASDMWSGSPYDVQMAEVNRGRYKPPTAERIHRMVVSFALTGQLQPILCLQNSEGKLEVVAGFCRTAAARLYRDGVKINGTQYHDPDFRIKCTVGKFDTTQALVANGVENAIRNETSAIDQAKTAIALMGEPHNLQAQEVAKLFGVDPSHISRVVKLLRLSDDLQEKVHTGRYTVAVGLRLIDEEPAEKRAAIAAKMDSMVGDNIPTVGDVNAANKIVTKAIEDKARQDEITAENKRIADAQVSNATVAQLPPHVLRDDNPQGIDATPGEAATASAEDDDAPFDVVDTPKPPVSAAPAQTAPSPTEEAKAPAAPKPKQIRTISELVLILSDVSTAFPLTEPIISQMYGLIDGTITAEEFGQGLNSLYDDGENTDDE